MKHFIVRYLDNRSKFYTILLERIPSTIFVEALKTATSPFEESDAVVKEIEEYEDSSLQLAVPKALMLDDLLKKSGIGQQLAKRTVSIKEALSTSERIEMIGYTLFEALSKQELTDSQYITTVALNRQRCLLNILQLRDDLDFHRLRLLQG